MEKIITQHKTDLPIGRTGFYFKEHALINKLSVYSSKRIPKTNLFKVELQGMKLMSLDEIGTVHESAYDVVIFDSHDQEIHDGCPIKISKILYAIFDTKSAFIGWPAEDSVIIKNLVTQEKIHLESLAPLKDGKVTKDSGLFIFEGEFLDGPSFYELSKTKHWRAFVNESGKVVYKGWCWEYSITDASLIVKRGRTSKKTLSIKL